MRDINEYLRPWGSVRSNRSGMLNSSMARALAPYDEASDEKYQKTLELLNQNSTRLHCVYCNAEAAEWDHLISVMQDTLPTGHGHTFGNLVPACSPCNKQKLTNNWEAFLKVKAGANYEDRWAVIERYRQHYDPQPLKNPAEVWAKLQGIRSQIVDLFAQADAIIRKASDA